LQQEFIPDFTLKQFDPETGVTIWKDSKNRIWYLDQQGKNFAEVLVDEVYALLRGIRTISPMIGVNKNG